MSLSGGSFQETVVAVKVKRGIEIKGLGAAWSEASEAPPDTWLVFFADGSFEVFDDERFSMRFSTPGASWPSIGFDTCTIYGTVPEEGVECD